MITSLPENNRRWIFPVFLLAMVIIVVSANILVQYPINNWLTWGALTYPLSYLITDLTNKVMGPAAAKKVVWSGFIVAVLLSALLATPRIAAASGSAFLLSQLLDIHVFNRLRQARWWKAPLISSTIGSALDTLVFFSLAFAGTTVPWVTLGIGDYAVKMMIAIILIGPYGGLLKRLQMKAVQ